MHDPNLTGTLYMTCHPEDHEIANNISELEQNALVGKNNKKLE